MPTEDGVSSWKYRVASTERTRAMLRVSLEFAKRQGDAQLIAELEGQLLRLGPPDLPSSNDEEE